MTDETTATPADAANAPESIDPNAPASENSGPIIARAGTYFRTTRYIMTLVLILYGAWSIYDGFVSWPNWGVTHPKEMPKSSMDILFNRVLGIALPPLGILMLIRCLSISRGVYRLEDGVVYIPGHPPVPLESILAVDRSKWDRKGVALVDYRVVSDDPSGNTDGSFKLDDFIYQRDPTDEIFKAIEQSMLKNPAVVAGKIAAPKTAIERPAALPRPAGISTKTAVTTNNPAALTKTATAQAKPEVNPAQQQPRPSAAPATAPKKSGASPANAPEKSPGAVPPVKPAGPPGTRMPPRPRL